MTWKDSLFDTSPTIRLFSIAPEKAIWTYLLASMPSVKAEMQQLKPIASGHIIIVKEIESISELKVHSSKLRHVRKRWYVARLQACLDQNS